MPLLHEINLAEEVKAASQEGRINDLKRFTEELKLPAHHRAYFLSIANKQVAKRRLEVALTGTNLSLSDRTISIVKAGASFTTAIAERSTAHFLARRASKRRS